MASQYHPGAHSPVLPPWALRLSGACVPVIFLEVSKAPFKTGSGRRD